MKTGEYIILSLLDKNPSSMGELKLAIEDSDLTKVINMQSLMIPLTTRKLADKKHVSEILIKKDTVAEKSVLSLTKKGEEYLSEIKNQMALNPFKTLTKLT